MNILEIVILVLAVSLVLFTVIYNIIRKLGGKSSCGCDVSKKSSGCSGCAGCGHKNKNNNDNEKNNYNTLKNNI